MSSREIDIRKFELQRDETMSKLVRDETKLRDESKLRDETMSKLRDETRERVFQNVDGILIIENKNDYESTRMANHRARMIGEFVHAEWKVDNKGKASREASKKTFNKKLDAFIGETHRASCERFLGCHY